jgi:hypothetical protein
MPTFPKLCPLAFAYIQPFSTRLLGCLTGKVVGIIGKVLVKLS